MATLLSRITDFQPSTPILSAQVDSELDQLVQILSGAVPGNNKKVLIKVSDAGDPPLELDQIGAGPIQEWYQNSLLKASITNAGQFSSTVTTGTAPLIVASTTKVDNLNADMVDGLHATSFIADPGSNGIIVRTGAGAAAARSLTAPASGLTISNADGTGGNPTFALANDLGALEGLGSTGIAVRTAANTWAQRAITGTANQITVTNGDGVSGNPTLSTPQNIHTGASPTFADLTLSGALTTTGNATVGATLAVTGKATGFIRNLTVNTSSVTANGTLMSYVIPAGTLASDGDYLTIHGTGTGFDGGDSLTTTLNATTVGFIPANDAPVNSAWLVDITIIRVSATSVRAIGSSGHDHANYEDSTDPEKTLIGGTVTVNNFGSNTNTVTFTSSGSMTQTALWAEYCQR